MDYRRNSTTVVGHIQGERCLVYTTIRQPGAYYRGYVAWISDDDLKMTDDPYEAWEFSRPDALSVADHLSETLHRPFRIQLTI